MLDALRRWWSGGQRPTGPVLVQPGNDRLGALASAREAALASKLDGIEAKFDQIQGARKLITLIMAVPGGAAVVAYLAGVLHVRL